MRRCYTSIALCQAAESETRILDTVTKKGREENFVLLPLDLLSNVGSRSLCQLSRKRFGNNLWSGWAIIPGLSRSEWSPQVGLQCEAWWRAPETWWAGHSVSLHLFSEEVAYQRGETRADDKWWGSEELILGGIWSGRAQFRQVWLTVQRRCQVKTKGTFERQESEPKSLRRGLHSQCLCSPDVWPSASY